MTGSKGASNTVPYVGAIAGLIARHSVVGLIGALLTYLGTPGRPHGFAFDGDVGRLGNSQIRRIFLKISAPWSLHHLLPRGAAYRYILYIHYTVSFHGAPPPNANWFQIPLVIPTIAVLIQQIGAFFKTMRRQRRETNRRAMNASSITLSPALKTEEEL